MYFKKVDIDQNSLVLSVEYEFNFRKYIDVRDNFDVWNDVETFFHNWISSLDM